MTFLISATYTFGQVDYDLSGYINEFPVMQFVRDDLSRELGIDKNFALNLMRLRVRPVIYFGDNGRLNIEVESAFLFYQNLTGFFSTNAVKSMRQIINLKWLVKNDKNISVLNFIDRLYYRHGYDWGNIVIGRQRIAWGTGRIWNPVDLFNPINPTTFYKIEKDGADAIAVKYYLGSFSDLNVVFNPSEKLNESNIGVRLRSNISGYDLSFIAGRFDKRGVAGFDLAGNLDDAGIRAEGLLSFGNKQQPESFFKYIVGIDYQFTSKFYALAEYHYNGEGKTNKLDYEFDRLVDGEILNLNKNYIALSGVYQLTPLLSATVSLINNLNDGSFFSGLTLNYSYSDNTYLNIGGQYFSGGSLTEYWYYSNTVYMQLEYYF